MLNRSKKKKQVRMFTLFIMLSSSLLLPIIFNSIPVITDNSKKDTIIIQYPKTAALGVGNLTQEMFPVVINKAYPTIDLALYKKDYSTIRVAYYSGDEWHFVPFQIDEIGAPPVWGDNTPEIDQALSGRHPEFLPHD